MATARWRPKKRVGTTTSCFCYLIILIVLISVLGLHMFGNNLSNLLVVTTSTSTTKHKSLNIHINEKTYSVTMSTKDNNNNNNDPMDNSTNPPPLKDEKVDGNQENDPPHNDNAATPQQQQQQQQEEAMTSEDEPQQLPPPPPQQQQNDNNNYDKMKNSKIAFMTLVDASETMDDFTKYIFPSLDTWLLSVVTPDRPYFVVMLQDFQEKFTNLCESYPAYCNRIQPLWATDCHGPDSNIGLPSCCKGQAGFRQLHQRLVDSIVKNGNDDMEEYDWYLYVEPRVYVRVDYMMEYVQPLDPKEAITITSGVARSLGLGDYDGSPYNCSVHYPSEDYLYPFGHPLLLSRGALDTLAPGALYGNGLLQQCQEYGDLTLDVGLQILPWMYSIPSLFVQYTYETPKKQKDEEWMIRIFVEDMHKLHQRIEGQQPIPAMEYHWHRTNGFRHTELFRQYGHPQSWPKGTWHLFKTQHCWFDPPPAPDDDNEKDDDKDQAKEAPPPQEEEGDYHQEEDPPPPEEEGDHHQDDPPQEEQDPQPEEEGDHQEEEEEEDPPPPEEEGDHQDDPPPENDPPPEEEENHPNDPPPEQDNEDDANPKSPKDADDPPSVVNNNKKKKKKKKKKKSPNGSDNHRDELSKKTKGQETKKQANQQQQEQQQERPRIAYITYAHLADTNRFDTKILPAFRTWYRPQDDPYFVVLNRQWQDPYKELCQQHAKECSRMHPIWVDCSEGYYGHSPCCKSQEGLREVYRQFPHYDWYIYQDDDMYLRVDYLRSLLVELDRDDPAIVCYSPRFPLGTSHFPDAYNCSFYEQDTYPWGQPVMYNQGAMQRILKGLELGGLTKQCNAFDVTHDAGNQIMHWMYSLPVLRVTIAQDDIMGLTDPKFPYTGDRDVAVGLHGLDKVIGIDNVHERYRKAGTPPHIAIWHNVTGFHKTQTYQQHGDPSTWTEEWYTMPQKECEVSQENQKLVKNYKRANKLVVDKYLEQQDKTNSPKVAFVTFNTNFPVGYGDFGFVQQSLDTWLDGFPVFVVMESYRRDVLYDEFCSRDEETDAICNRLVPVWIDCEPQVFAEACFAQHGLQQMRIHHPEFDWIVYARDNTYIRNDYVHAYLQGLDPSKPLAVMTGESQTLSSYGCILADQASYPRGEIAVYSRAAVERLRRGLYLGSLYLQARALEVYLVSEVLQVVSWMYSLPTLRLPISLNRVTQILDQPEGTDHKDSMGVFNVDSGAGSQTMQSCHKIFGKMPVPPMERVWHNSTGFKKTKLYKEFGDPAVWKKTWHIMEPHDCQW